MQEDYSRTPTPRLLKEIQEAKKHIPQLQEQLSKATGSPQVRGVFRVCSSPSDLGVPRGGLLEEEASWVAHTSLIVCTSRLEPVDIVALGRPVYIMNESVLKWGLKISEKLAVLQVLHVANF